MIPLRDTEPSATSAYVTIWLIVVNVLVFLYEVSLDPYTRNLFIATYGMTPARFHAADILTSMFLHGGWMHLIGNMWFLWIFGDNIEDILGHAKYLVFYVACGVAASVFYAMISPDTRVPTVGASGAIAGVMGAYCVKFPRSRILTLIPIFIFFTTVEIPAAVVLVYWFIVQFFSGVGSVGFSQSNHGGIAFFAHVGGFIAGIVLIFVLPTRRAFQARADLRW